MSVYYGFWNMILAMPEEMRIFLGVCAIAAAIYCLWPLEKYIFVLLLRIGICLNLIVMGGVRVFLPRLVVNRRHDWDEKTAACGRRIENWLQTKRQKIMGGGRRELVWKKTVWLAFVCVYVTAILPSFQLESRIPESDLTRFYGLNRFFLDTEARLTKGIEAYPPFWIQEAAALEETEEETQEEVREPVRLELNESTTYANIRKEADIDSPSLYAVSKEDEILYEHSYEHDSQRYWLKVRVPSHDDLQGWISANVIEPEIVDALELQ